MNRKSRWFAPSQSCLTKGCARTESPHRADSAQIAVSICAARPCIRASTRLSVMAPLLKKCRCARSPNSTRYSAFQARSSWMNSGLLRV